MTWVVIYSEYSKPMATGQGFTSLLRHSQEQNQAAEEEQGAHDQSGDQESSVLGARRHTVNIACVCVWRHTHTHANVHVSKEQ